MRRLLPLISMLLLFSSFSIGQPWSNILASSRAINWSNAGLPASLPDGEKTQNPWTPPTRTQCGSTIAAGASATTVNAALAACANGTYVLLGAGTFNFSSASITLYAQNGVTLRGSGATSTILKLTGTSQIQFGISWNNGSCSWASGFSVGTNSLTMTSCSGSALVAGELVFLKQCDTGYSGSGCTGTSADNGGLYVCGLQLACDFDGGSGPHSFQQQTVYVTSVTGTGPYTVNFTPGLVMPNWSSGNGPTVNWVTASSGGHTVTPYGNGLEDLTVDATGGITSNAPVYLNNTYGSWIKGVRILGTGGAESLFIGNTKNCLAFNNYIAVDDYASSSLDLVLLETASSDNLLLNNIHTGGIIFEGLGSSTGNVLSYSYGRDTFTSWYENSQFEHYAGSAFLLYEGNQSGQSTEDDTWGTHTLNTWFRNYVSGWDSPYKTSTPRGFTWDAFARFENAIGNAIGNSSSNAALTTYQATSGDSGYVYRFDGAGPSDPLTLSSSMRWGNCDTVTNTCRFASSEVPTSLSGNAAPFENTVPGTSNLPCSFFLSGYSSTTCNSHPSGGTGLSWWKVCTSWTTFPTACATTQLQPFPPIGPDVTGGSYVNGAAYDIPAAIAFQNLPIDSNYQNSYSISSSSWSNGTETLTVGGLPGGSTHILGGFQITGTPACNSPAGGEFAMTSSSSATVSYAMASNPGSCAGGTMKWPDVRQFDERVYENDSSGGPPPPPAPTGLTAIVH